MTFIPRTAAAGAVCLTIIMILPFTIGTSTPISVPVQPAKAVVVSSRGSCSLIEPRNGSLPAILRCAVAPSDDAYVENLSPSRNFGDGYVLIVQAIPSVPILRNIAYLKFGLADVLPSSLLDVHARPINATLWMYVRLTTFLYNASIQIHPVEFNNWTEKSIEWDNQPQIAPAPFAVARITRNGTWVHWNLTSVADFSAVNSTELSLAATASSVAWGNLAYFDSNEYPSAKGETAPGLDLVFKEPSLTVQAPYPNLPVTIGNRTFVTDANGKLKLLLPWGSYAVSVPQTILQSDGRRLYFVGWSDNITEASRLLSLGNDLTLLLHYETQYQLTVNSAYGVPNGSGWYFAGRTATASVYPTTVPIEGPLGYLGVRYVFDRWEGACMSTQAECNITMNSSMVANAIWRVDYTLTVTIGVAIIAFLVLLNAIRLRKRTGPSRKSKRKKKTR